MEVQTEYVHIAYTFFLTGANLCAQLALVSKISASELSRRFIKGPLLVGNGHLFFLFYLLR